jgi:hypothetical protein
MKLTGCGSRLGSASKNTCSCSREGDRSRGGISKVPGPWSVYAFSGAGKGVLSDIAFAGRCSSAVEVSCSGGMRGDRINSRQVIKYLRIALLDLRSSSGSGRSSKRLEYKSEKSSFSIVNCPMSGLLKYLAIRMRINIIWCVVLLYQMFGGNVWG